MEVGVVFSDPYGFATKGSVRRFSLISLTLWNSVGRTIVTQRTMLNIQPIADNKPR
jgi:hypothetical protein